MLIIYGYSNFGKVDRVPGLFHVATQFAHGWWLPSIPKESYLFPESEAAGFDQPLQLPLHWRSVFLAWGRVWGAILGIFVIPCLVAINLPHNQPTPLWARLLALVTLALPFLTLAWVVLSFFRQTASAKRALILARFASVPIEELTKHYPDKVRLEDAIRELELETGDQPVH